MIKMYVMQTCLDREYVERQVEGNCRMVTI